MKFLLIKRRGYHDSNFFWRLVKGRKRSGETDEDALKREIEEETGLEKFNILKKIYSYSFISPEGDKVKVNTYLVFAKKDQRLQKKDEEEDIVEYKWASFDEAKELLHYVEEIEAVQRAKENLNHPPFF